MLKQITYIIYIINNITNIFFYNMQMQKLMKIMLENRANRIVYGVIIIYSKSLKTKI